MLYESPTFRLEADDQILTLWLDFRGRSSHTLTLTALNELALILDRIATLPSPDVIVLRSGHPGTFLEEFDSAEIGRFTSPIEFAALARRGQDVARKLESLNSPTVAFVEGRCAGAGLELALACSYRVATDGAASRFEMPDARRGLLPACGGTYRLPRLVGISAALRILLDGKVHGAHAARRLGLIDQVLPSGQSAIAFQNLLDRLRSRGRTDRGRLRERVRRVFGSLIATVWDRPLQARLTDEITPTVEIRNAIAAGLSSEGEGLAAERAALLRLTASQSTRRLLDLHRQAGNSVRTFGEPANPISPAPKRVGIVGGGELGTALACRLARLGQEVMVQERDGAALERASRRVTDRLAAMSQRRELSAAEAATLARAIRPTADWVGFDQAELVIEAADEDAGVKRNLFHELERRVRPRVLLATAASTVPVESIQVESGRPGRVAGLHFPNPTGRQPIAEIVGTPLTEVGTMATLARWVSQWGFTPVRVADRPGRLVDHVKLTYLTEGVSLVAEGLPADEIDRGCRQFGMMHGPLEWCDEIGFERLAELTAQMQLVRGDNFARNLLFQRLIPFGCVGAAVGEGFYRYGWRKRPSQIARMALWNDLDEDAIAPYVFDPVEALRDGIERVVLRTVNAAAAALAEEPDADPAMVDLALTFGMGWAPVRGGPLRYADDRGLTAVVERLALFAERYGPRFIPCDELIRRAEASESFFGGPSDDPAIPTFEWRRAG